MGKNNDHQECDFDDVDCPYCEIVDDVQDCDIG